VSDQPSLIFLPPPVRTGESPQLSRLGEYTFQELCRDLFDQEPSVATCDIYGTRGQGQDGIDLLAHRKGADGIEVGQCKCYASCSPADIKKVSKEFFDHWGRWSKESVRRFILFVGCDLDNTKKQNEIISQRNVFATYKIAYEVWSAAKIRNKLRPHQGIVATYFNPPDYWVQVICGTTAASLQIDLGQAQQTVTIVETALVTQVDQLSSRVTVSTERRIDQIRLAWKEGRLGEVDKEIDDLKSDTVLWNILASQTKAKILRLESSWILEKRNDVVRAKTLADEAQLLDPSLNLARLRALIAYRETGPEAGLKWLDGQTDVDSLNLKAGLLLELGRVDDARAVLQFDEDSDGRN
jgi:hypothetical protein